MPKSKQPAPKKRAAVARKAATKPPKKRAPRTPKPVPAPPLPPVRDISDGADAPEPTRVPTPVGERVARVMSDPWALPQASKPKRKVWRR